MSPYHETSRLRGPLLPRLLKSLVYICLLLNSPTCHAAPRSMLQATPGAAPAAGASSNEGNADDVSGLLIGGTLVPDQLMHGIVVILRLDGSLGTGVLIKPAFVLTAGHVVGVASSPNSGSFVANPAISPTDTKICQSTSGSNWYAGGINCVMAKTFSFPGAGDVALVGLDEDALILPGSWGSSQTYPSPSKYTNGYLFTLGSSYPQADQQVTLYGAGPGSQDVLDPGLVRNAIFNTVGSCSAHSCDYTTTQPCAQKNSAGGDSGGPVFDSGNVLVGIHNAGWCGSNPDGPTDSSYLPVTSVLDWIESTANTNGCSNGNTNMIGATLIGQRTLSGIQDTLQIYQCYLGAPGEIYISLNSSQSFFKKEAVLISDSCGSQSNICDITVQAGQDNVNQPQVCVPGQLSSPTGTPLSSGAVGSSFAFDVYKDGSLISQHTGASSALDSVCVSGSVPGAVEFQTNNFIGGGILMNWIGVGCSTCPGYPSGPTGSPNPSGSSGGHGDLLSGYGK